MVIDAFRKTEKGRLELATRQYKLPSRHRQMLILVDGDKSRADLMSIVADAASAQSIFDQLLAGGFVEPVGRSGSDTVSDTPASDDASTETETETETVSILESSPEAPAAVGIAIDTQFNNLATADDEVAMAPRAGVGGLPTAAEIRIEGARIIMHRTTQDYLGLLGAELANKISQARNKDALLNVVPRWHLALRESRKGRHEAQRFLSSVMAALDQ